MAGPAKPDGRSCGTGRDAHPGSELPADGGVASAPAGEAIEPPSPAELTVLRLLATDLSVRQIGAELYVSPNTVRSHTRTIYRKLGVRSREQAVARASALGLIGGTRSPG